MNRTDPRRAATGPPHTARVAPRERARRPFGNFPLTFAGYRNCPVLILRTRRGRVQRINSSRATADSGSGGTRQKLTRLTGTCYTRRDNVRPVGLYTVVVPYLEDFGTPTTAQCKQIGTFTLNNFNSVSDKYVFFFFLFSRPLLE